MRGAAIRCLKWPGESKKDDPPQDPTSFPKNGGKDNEYMHICIIEYIIFIIYDILMIQWYIYILYIYIYYITLHYIILYWYIMALPAEHTLHLPPRKTKNTVGLRRTSKFTWQGSKQMVRCRTACSLLHLLLSILLKLAHAAFLDLLLANVLHQSLEFRRKLPVRIGSCQCDTMLRKVSIPYRNSNQH